MCALRSNSGEVAEWSKAVDSKSIVGQPTAGSNPALSAIFIIIRLNFYGEMTEWTKVLAWNASVGQPTVGSNPTLSAISANSARPKVVVGSSWSGIREPRQDRKVATVSVPPRCGGTRPSPGAQFSVTVSA